MKARYRITHSIYQISASNNQVILIIWLVTDNCSSTHTRKQIILIISLIIDLKKGVRVSNKNWGFLIYWTNLSYKRIESYLLFKKKNTMVTTMTPVKVVGLKQCRKTCSISYILILLVSFVANLKGNVSKTAQ
jgi:hypothetical protein